MSLPSFHKIYYENYGISQMMVHFINVEHGIQSSEKSTYLKQINMLTIF